MVRVATQSDVFIAGGGPAGLTAAIAMRNLGLTVTVADGTHPPADKACGEGLMPDSLAALEALGIRLPEQETHPFRGIRFIDGDRSVAADFPAAPGRGVRRTVLHRVLAEHAASVGVQLLWNTPVDPARLPEARWLIGADGGGSLIRKHAGLDRAPSRRRFGFRRHYRVAPWSEYVDIHWGKGFQIYVTPVGPDCVGVAAITDDPALRLDAAIEATPALARHLNSSSAVTTDRGAVTASLCLASVTRGNLALIGDASGSIDAITGEGLSLAFRQAPVLAAAVATGNLALYEAEHRRIARRPAAMAKLLLALGDYSLARSVAFGAMDLFPAIFRTMLALHIHSHESNLSSRLSVPDSGLRSTDHSRSRPGPDARTLHAE